jgi:putative restriction endonuclease
MAKNWDYAARIVWSILTKRAKQGRTITYGQIAPDISTTPRNVGRALGPIQDFCLETRLPPLTAIVVNLGGKPGGGFIAWDVDDIDTANKMVFEFDWGAVVNPYGKFGPKDSEDSLADTVIDDPDRAGEVYAKVRARGVAQRVFKSILLKAYDYRCAFCGLSFESALEGSHIVPWSKCSRSERIDPRNGLLLCSSHHRMFDSGDITVSRSFKIYYCDAEMEDGPYSAADKTLSVLLHGKKIRLPKDRRHWPSVDLLKTRHELDEWGDVQ